MFNKYSEDSEYIIEVRLNSVDEVNKKLQLEIGFYQKFDILESVFIKNLHCLTFVVNYGIICM